MLLWRRRIDFRMLVPLHGRRIWIRGIVNIAALKLRVVQACICKVPMQLDKVRVS